MKVVVFVVFLLLHIWGSFGQTEAAVGIPSSILTSVINVELMPTLNNEIKTVALPDHCCYDHVESSLVHLNIQNIKEVPQNSDVSGSVSSSNSGLAVAFHVDFEMDFFFRLCIHLNPFSKHSCSTVDGCKGNGFLHFAGDGGLTIAAGPNPNNGQIVLIASGEHFAVNANKHSLCSKLYDGVVAQFPKIDKEVAAELATQVAPYLAKYQNLPQYYNVSSFMAAGWHLIGGTRTTPNGLILASLLPIYAHHLHDKTGPFVPQYPLPDANQFINAASNQVAAVFSDSVFSNAVWSYFVTIDNPTFNISFLQDYLHIKLTQPPQVQFDATGTSIIIIGSLTWANATSSFDGTFKQIIQVSVSVVADKQISAQLAAGQLTVQITNMKNIVIAASTVQQTMTTMLKAILPLVNSHLTPVDIPTFPPLSFSSIRLSFGQGYVLVLANAKVGSSTYTPPLDNVFAIACPNIYHPSGCI